MNRFGQIVNFVLKLLNITMSLVIFGGILVVAPIEFFVVLFLCLLNLLVHILDDLVHVLALADLAEDVALELEHGLLDDAVVEVDHVARYLSLELRVPVHDWLQVLFAQAIGINMMQSLVEELRAVAEEVFVTANDGLLTQLHVEVALLLVREADAVLARLLFLFGRALRDDVDLFVDLVIFLENVLLSGVESRLQGLEHLDHELRVLRVLPTIYVGVKVWPLNPLHVLLLHPEVYLEEVDEVGEEEAAINVRLNMIGQFSHETNIDLRFDGIVLVICPIILKVAFKSFGHLFGEWATSVEVSKEAEPF